MQIFRLKYRLCMEHSFDSNIKNKHHHVIEIEIFVRPESLDFMEFSDMETLLHRELDPYQNQYLNEFEEFGDDTTIENIGEVAFKKLSQAYESQHYIISRLEISETPLRVYAIVAEEF